MTDAPAPQQARKILIDAEKLSLEAHRSVRLPYIVFLLALGVATSFGTFGMGMSDGRAFWAMYFATIFVGVALVIGFSIAVRDHAAFARSRRWCAYIAAWLIPYTAAVATVVWAHGNVTLTVMTSLAILVSTSVCACWEARS